MESGLESLQSFHQTWCGFLQTPAAGCRRCLFVACCFVCLGQIRKWDVVGGREEEEGGGRRLSSHFLHQVTVMFVLVSF